MIVGNSATQVMHVVKPDAAGEPLQNRRKLEIRAAFQRGLMAAVLDRDAAGRLVRKAGIMGVVLMGGEVRPGDPIRVTLPPEPHRPLERV